MGEFGFCLQRALIRRGFFRLSPPNGHRGGVLGGGRERESGGERDGSGVALGREMRLVGGAGRGLGAKPPMLQTTAERVIDITAMAISNEILQNTSLTL